MKKVLLSTLLVLPTMNSFAIDTGPEVGERIPAFEVQDQAGETRTFEDLKGPEGLLLLFHRTADW